MENKLSTKRIKWRFTKKQCLGFGRAWYVIGSADELGKWNPSKALRLKWGEADNWSIEVLLPADQTI